MIPDGLLAFKALGFALAPDGLDRFGTALGNVQG